MNAEQDYKIKQWIVNPFPIWDPYISSALIESITPLINFKRYSIQQSLTGVYDSQQLVSINADWTSPLLELPSVSIKTFYKEHGLEPVNSENTILKLHDALSIIKLVELVYSDVTLLVKTMQIIRSEQSETDISYSHPGIPFSIFFSLCEDVSSISNLRVAESILHEAMHLKLSLVERYVPLVELDSKLTYFSPWRDEQRPIRGVLHGLFVFRALFDFFKAIKIYQAPSEEFGYIDKRINQIKKEICMLKDFSNCAALTNYGKKLAKALSYSVLQ